jgi:PAS domain S-box-containing protein
VSSGTTYGRTSRRKPSNRSCSCPCSPAEFDALRAAAGLLGATIDRERAEAARGETEERYSRLVEVSPVAIAVHAEGRFVFANAAFAELVGADSPERLIGMPTLDVVHPEYHELVRERGRAAIDERREAPMVEERLVRLDGTVIDVEVAGIPFTFQGRPAAQIVVRDITERKRAEEHLHLALETERQATQQLRDLDDMKNAFLNAVSHELRTPLSALLGSALTLERMGLDLTNTEQTGLLHAVATNAQKLQRLLEDLLDLDRLTRGITTPVRTPTDVSELVRRLVDELALAGERTIEVDAEPVTTEVDAPKVERIVENLLANALRHTGSGARVWVKVVPDEGGVTIVVEDEGEGVQAELREAIFEPFQRVEDESEPPRPGVGIGLSLVAKFAELHGGRAWVEDRPGGGSSFRVFLPAEMPTMGSTGA